MRIFAAIWAVLFAVFVALQYNDPDPVEWMFIYGAAMVVCIAYAMNHALRQTALAVAGIALVWGISLVPQYVGKAGPADMFQSMKAEKPEIEEERESGGLFIVTGVMAVLAFGRRRTVTSPAAAPVGHQE